MPESPASPPGLDGPAAPAGSPGLPGICDATDVCRFVNASPSPFHAVRTASTILDEAGFTAVEARAAWSAPESGQRSDQESGPGSDQESGPGSGQESGGGSRQDTPGGVPSRGYLARAGALIAWDLGPGDLASAPPPATPFRIVGAHTDSPTLRVKPRPDLSRGAWDQLAVEVYGGPLLNSWLDRDLGLSGRVAVRTRGGDPVGSEALGRQPGLHTRLVRVDEPVLRIPQLAVHLDRAVNEAGVKLNPQAHVVPVWGASGTAPGFAAYLADLVGCDVDDVLGWDVMTHDLTPARRVGLAGDLIAGARLDNLASCLAAIRALTAATTPAAGSTDQPRGAATDQPTGAATDRAATIPVVVLFDHEEIGSTTDRGAVSPLLMSVLERLVAARGGTREDLWRALAGTVTASADMAHAVHPNYPERHEPAHQPMVNAGPVLKINQRGRYATDALGEAVIRVAAEQAEVPLQVFVSRGDMPCGSTIGPFVAAATGAATVDLGCAMLAMHSARELAGAADPGPYAALLAAFLRPA